jgi:type VI secretion system secreted protein Hcp
MALFDAFLKIDGCPGESEADGHKDEIDLMSFSWGQSNAGSFAQGGGGGTGKVNMQDFHFVMKLNKASPKLAFSCATGSHIPQALLTVRKAGGDKQQPFLTYKFSDVLVSSYQTGGAAHGSDPVPTDQVSLNFAKVEMEYKVQDSKGALGAPVHFGWDLKKGVKI